MKGFLLLILIFSLTSAFAENISNEIALEYIYLKNIKSSVDSSVDTSVSQILSANPDADKQKIYQIVSKAIGWGTLEHRITKLVIDTYSIEELKGLIEFYKTPIGKSVIQKSPAMVAGISKLISTNLQEISEDDFEAALTSNKRKFTLSVLTDPPDSRVRIMNIDPKYTPGIFLTPGSYDVLVSKSGYISHRDWVKIDDEDITINVSLKKGANKPTNSKRVKVVGEYVTWEEYRNIDSDDCVSIPFMGTTCHTVKYLFKFRGRVIGVDKSREEYDVKLTSREIIPQERVSAMYWSYKNRAQYWANQQETRAIEFEFAK